LDRVSALHHTLTFEIVHPEKFLRIGPAHHCGLTVSGECGLQDWSLCVYGRGQSEVENTISSPCLKTTVHIVWPTASCVFFSFNANQAVWSIHRVTMTSFCSISMPVDFFRHLVGKKLREMFVTVMALK